MMLSKVKLAAYPLRLSRGSALGLHDNQSLECGEDLLRSASICQHSKIWKSKMDSIKLHNGIWYRRHVHGEPVTWCLSPDSLGCLKATVHCYSYLVSVTEFREEVSLHISKVCLTAIWSGGCHHDLSSQKRKVSFARLVGDFNSRKGAVNETG